MLRKLVWLPLTVLFAYFAMTDVVFAASTPAGPDIAAVAASRIPLYFELNQGQTAAEVRFLARAGGYTAFLTGQETVLHYHNRMPGRTDGRDAVVRMRLTGSRESSTIGGGERLPGMVNYLVGDDPSKWHTRIPTYADVDRDQVYPGVDLTYRADGKQLEFDFHLAPGANPDPIRMTYSGASSMHLDVAGDLILDTEAGPVSILKPFAYQEVASERVPIAVSYALLPGGEVGFQVGKYDHNRALVIDPTVGPSVDYSTYLGSGSGDTFTSIAVDAAGEAFITGSTYWNNYPTGALPGYSPYSSTFPQTYYDASLTVGFVTALNAIGTGIIYSTYIAGNSASSSTGVALNGIAVDATGFAFVGGQTDDSTFPKVKAFQTAIPSSRSGYGVALGVVFELSQHGDSLIYSSFLGGGDYDTISAVAVDSSDNAYVTGTNTVQGGSLTTSGFPITGGVIWGHFTQQNIGAGFNDAFAAKITPPTSGNAVLAYSTVIGSGGSNTPFTYGSAIAVDSSGDAYIAGSADCNIGDHGGTITTNLNMTHVTRAQSEYVNNVWVLKLNPAATAATYIAYLGGSAPGGTYSPDTSVAGIKVDSSGLAYVAGTTEANNFQTTSGAYQTTKQLAGVSNSGTEQSDGFVTVIAAGGASFAYSTYLNGTTVSAAAITDNLYGSPTISGIALGTGGQFAVAGLATTTNFPTSGSPAGTPLISAFPGCPGNCADSAAFITKFTTSGLVYSAFLGAGNEAGVNGIASNGTDVYVMLGELANGLNSCGAYDTDNSSGNKELVVRVLDAPAIATTVSVDSKTADVSSSQQTISLTSSISASSTVNGGTATYAVINSSAAQIGSAVTSEVVANGLPPSLSFTLPANTPTGTYTITEHYCGAEGFLNSSATGSLVVSSPAPATTTAVTSSLNPSVYGQSVTFTATVSSAGTAPTGSVQFAVDGTNLGAAVALTAASSTSKTATSQATTTLPGTGSPHTVLASYLNTDGNFSDSSGTLSAGQTVTLATQATLTVTGVPNTAQVYGATFTVGSSGGSGTGAVTYTATGSCSVAGTTVTMTSGSGTCSVTAAKATDGDYTSSTSASTSVSAMPATQATVTVTGVPNTAPVYGTTFTVGSSGGSGTGAVTYATTGSCSVSGTTVTVTSGSGTCSVTATKAADTHYLSASSPAASVSAALATQATLTVTGVPNTVQAYAATFTVSNSGGSGTGAVTYAATGSCSVSGTTVTMTSGSGTCSVTASRAADGNYASASSAAGTVNAALATQAALTVTGVPNTTQAYGATFTVGSSGGSGTGSVTYSAPGSCSVSGTTVTMTSGSGTCSVTASRAADGNYSSAISAAATVTAIRAAAPVSVWPTASSITYGQTLASSVLTGGTASAAGSFAFTTPGTAPGAGTASQSVTFTPADSADYTPTAGAVSVTVNKVTPTVSAWPAASSIVYGQTLASSILTGGTASVSGTFTWTTPAITPGVGTGAESVTFTPTDPTDYNTVTGSASVTENKATATVTLGNLTQPYSGSAITVTALTAPANLTVTFAYTENGEPVTSPAGVGTYVVTATINSSNYNGTATGTLTISQATQTISFTPPVSPVFYGVAPISLAATGGASGNAVTFSVVSGPGLVSGSTLTITGAGTVVVAANQAGNGNYSAAAQVLHSIVAAVVSLNFNVAAFDFSSVPLGSTSPDQTLILTNPNGQPVTVNSIQASGDFSVTYNCPIIAALATCSVNITFTPTASGARSGTLTVTEGQSNNPQSIPLTGMGTAPGILVTPALLDFGSQVVPTTSTGQAITIMNTGTAALTISNIAISGDFATSGNCASIPAGSNCSLTVTFTPTTTGVRAGTVTLTANDGGGTQSQVVNLTAMGTQAGATLTPSVQLFPGTLVGASSFVLNATLTNSGSAPLSGIVVSILGDFTQTNSCTSALAPAASCIINVTYAPTVAGAESGSLTITNNLGTQTVSLAGTGQAPGASLNTAQLVYGGQLVGTSALAQTVIFSNTGNAAVNIASVVPTSNFTDTTNCSGAIAAGTTCSVNVLFTPTTTGPLSGTMTIIDSAGTQAVTMQGQGVSPGLAVSPSFVIFGEQEVDTTSQAQTMTVTNTGTAPLTLSPITVSNNFAQTNQCPAILLPGAGCAISVSLSPTAIGMLSGSLIIRDASGLISTLATVSGQGTLPGITPSPATLSFGSLPVGTPSQAQTVTVTNSGTAPLQIGTVSGSGDFGETDTCSGQTIAAGSYCVISVTMTPTTLGPRTGVIQFNDNADGVHQIALNGMGQQAGVNISPTSLAFGSLPFVSSAQASSATGTSLSVTLGNTGDAALQLGGFSTQGDFTESDSCGAAIAPGATCTLTIQFVPTALGQRTGTLTITDHAGSGTQSVSLLGYGSPGGLTLSPPLLNFGVTTRGHTTAAQTATLANHSGQAITGLAITASGEFSESDNCGTALASGASCTLNITATPQTVGAITGAISISSGSAAPQAQQARVRAEEAASSAAGNVGVVAVLAYTTSQANAASQLAFGTPPAPAVTAGGNAGSYVTVQEDGSNGSLVNATDTVTISVTGPGGYSNAYTATASGGIAIFNLGSHALTAAGGYTYTATVASNPSIRAVVAGVTVTGGGARVSATAGSGQTAVINQAFANPLRVLVTDTQNNPLSGTTVIYTAPATGAGVQLSSASATTASDGTAGVSMTANGNAGSYTVTAAVAGAAAASFTLTNAKATPTLTWATPASIPYGTALSSTQLNATAGGIAGSFVYTPAAGTVLNAGQQTLSAMFTATDAADYNPAAGTVVLRVNQMASTVSVASSSRESLLQNAVTFTATASALAGTPTGIVNFLDGASVLGSGTLTAGMATFTTTSLAAGSHSITAVYSGDTNHGLATSATLAQLVIDFAVTAGSGGSGAVQSVPPGGSATYTIAIAPTVVTAFPVPATLTVTGLPPGATAALTTAPWARLTGTSWQLPANTVLSAVSLTFDIPLQTASGRGADAPTGGPLLLGILLLPLAGKLRRCGKRTSRTILMLWLLAAGVAATTGLSGCASGNGFFGQAQKTYMVTVTVTAGTLSHSTNLTLTVQ